MTKVFDFKDKIVESEIDECASGLKCGKLVVFPTETVYGIGANALDKEAVERIFKAKGRPNDNPLIVHVSNKDMLFHLADRVNDIEEKIIDTFCPGPLTIILPRKRLIPDIVTCGLDTVGIRMPSNRVAHDLIQKAGIPVAAPSANISGKPSGTNIEDIFDELKDQVEYMIDGGNCDIGVESTVVKVIEGKVKILRPGKITPGDFQSHGLEVVLDEHIFKEAKADEMVESPGMKHRHYAPKLETILIHSHDEAKLIAKMNEILDLLEDQSVCIIGCREHVKTYSQKKIKAYLNVGSKENMEEISKNIFSALRKVDQTGAKICLIEGVEKKGIGIAIMNRLFRACAGNVIEV